MRTIISRWFMFGLLLGWALTHATVFAQPAGKATDKPGDKLRAALDKPVSIDFTGNSMVDVLNHFRDKTGIAINVDQFALMQMNNFDGGGMFPGVPMQQIHLKANNEKAGQVLRKLLNGHQLAFVIFEDAVLVSTEEAALMRQMRQRINVDLEDVPFNKAVRGLAKNHGLNVVIDPKVAKQAEANISLQVENTGIETAVRLLSELASLKAVRMGNVLFITSEDKADKIRKEEPQQFDNPFNPGVPPVMRGGIGIAGFGGGMVAPAIPVQAIPRNAGPMIDPAVPGVVPGVVPPDRGVPERVPPMNPMAVPPQAPRVGPAVLPAPPPPPPIPPMDPTLPQRR